MKALLERIRVESATFNPFVGQSQAPALREWLSQNPSLAGDSVAWSRLRSLGRAELRLGNEQQAIEVYDRLHVAVEPYAAKVKPHQRVDLLLRRAVARMRLAETLNCVKHHTAESCLLPIRGGGIHVDQKPAEEAMVILGEALTIAELDSRQGVTARWLLNLAAMYLGRYPDGVPERYRIEPSAFDSDEEFPRFNEIAPRLGVATFDLSGGAIADDFDNDGFLDLVVSTLDTGGQLRFYKNDADGTFTERTHEAGLTGLWGGLNMIQTDYDNDGFVDIYVLRGGWFRLHGRHPNSLLRNQGDGTFRDVTFAAGLGLVHYPTQTADWGDYDRDGDLDLYVGTESREGDLMPSQLFRNNGDGTFTDVAEAAGVTNDRFAKGVVWGDFDADGRPDLYVSNMGDPNRLYRNLGDGTFSDVAAKLQVVQPLNSFPAWFWDYDNDGHLDLFVTSYYSGSPEISETNAFYPQPEISDVAAEYLGLNWEHDHDRLYRGQGDGTFREVSAEVNLRGVTVPMGANFGDLDNDGFLDFFLGTGYPSYEALMPNLMFRNRSGKDFANVTTAGGFGHLQKGHGIVFADLDNDGDQDVYAQMGGAYLGDRFGNALFENPGFDNAWIKLQLVGRRSNRSAIGARIRVDVLEDGRRRSIYRWVGTGGSFGGNPLRQEIGLGQAQSILRVEVRWPMEDSVDVYEDLPLRQLARLTEGDPTPHIAPLRAVSFAEPGPGND